MTLQVVESFRKHWAKATVVLFAALLSITLIPSGESYANEIVDADAKTTVPVVKLWNDNCDQDGIRPDSVKVMLFADGIYTGKTLSITESEGWKDAFTNLPKYAGGHLIVYTVLEDVPEGYLPLITPGVVGGYIITNTHCPETICIEGVKTWNDAENQDGIRPEAITVNLLANGEVVDTIEVTSADAVGDGSAWVYSFKNLPKYEKGVEIVYTVSEESVEGYAAEYVEGTIDIINTHTPETISFIVTKVWDDAENQDGIRPEAITVNLLANGEVVDTVEVTTSDAVGDSSAWVYAFENLPKYENGVEIAYTVEEGVVSEYSSVVTGDPVNGFVITNTYLPAEDPAVPEDDEDSDSEDEEEVVLAPTGDKAPFVILSLVVLISACMMVVAWYMRRSDALRAKK